MKIKYLILCFVASLLASCGEIDESNLKLYPSKLYLGVSGYNLQEIYDMCVRIIWCAKVRKIAELSKSAFHNCGDNFHTAFSIARFLFFGMQFVLDGTIRKR